jgi:hypothetical protein
MQVFGDMGRHARSAVGVSCLPFGVTTEVEAVVEASINASVHTYIRACIHMYVHTCMHTYRDTFVLHILTVGQGKIGASEEGLWVLN